MPSKPIWYSNIENIISSVNALPRPFVDRAAVEFIFKVGRRRAHQIMAPVITERIGGNGIADREEFVSHLRRLSGGNEAYYQHRRRRSFAEILTSLQKDRREKPQLLVEAPVEIVNQKFENLPAGVNLECGRITVNFVRPQEALEKLLALAMAIGNDFESFEQQVGNRQKGE